MIDIKVKDGDTVKDSTGKLLEISDKDVLFQRVLICIGVKNESFIYNRNLGSRLSKLDFNAEDAKEKAELIINEALAEFEDTYVKVLEAGEAIKLEITIGDESRIEEVRLNGNV